MVALPREAAPSFAAPAFARIAEKLSQGSSDCLADAGTRVDRHFFPPRSGLSACRSEHVRCVSSPRDLPWPRATERGWLPESTRNRARYACVRISSRCPPMEESGDLVDNPRVLLEVKESSASSYGGR